MTGSRFLGEVVRAKSGIGVKDAFDADRPALLLETESPPVAGSFVIATRRDGAAEIESVVATAQSARAALYRIAASRGLNPVFPDEVEREVQGLLDNDGIDDPTLVDLTAIPFVTIDGETSKDLDQALFLEETERGYRVRYALADAAYYVRPGTALFKEALRRGASFYLPGFMVPMLPRPLSEGLVSLNPGVDRRAMLIDTELDHEGQILGSTISRVRIRSAHKLSFGRVQRYYEGERFGDAAVEKSLDLLKTVGELRMRDAVERNVVRYRRTELAIDLMGAEGARFIVTTAARHRVELYNEQLSLLCNAEGARFLRDGAETDHVQPIYRVHPPPSAKKIEAFESTLEALCRAHRLDESVWRWERAGDKTLAEFLRELPSDGDAARIARAVHRQAIMVNVRSSFQEEADGHHGVGADAYARFSAPMREIVGVFLHKETWEKLAGEGLKDEELRDAIVTRANDVKMVQKRITDEANRLVIDQLFAVDMVKELSERGRAATVMGMTHGKVYVLLDDPAIDLKIYVRHLRRAHNDESMRLSKDRTRLIRENGQTVARIGDAVTVRVVERDEKGDRWVLSIDEPSE